MSHEPSSLRCPVSAEPALAGPNPARAQLESILRPLAEEPTLPKLPDWSYRRWHLMLQYPDLQERSHELTKMLGRARDAALTHPGVAALVDWAGARRRSDPVSGAAAALVELRAIRGLVRDLEPDGVGDGTLDWSAVADRLLGAIDRAPRLGLRSTRRSAPFVEPDRLAATDVEPATIEDPRLSGIVGNLLGLTGDDPGSDLLDRVLGAVLQAGDWWARHAAPSPEHLAGPSLPGIVPAHRLREDHRLSAHVSDSGVLGLVAGPRPGRNRPCQLAWRRGLAFWAAAWLATGSDGPLPDAETLSWWRIELSRMRRTDEGRGIEPSYSNALPSAVAS